MRTRWIRAWSFVLVVFLSCPLPPPAQAAKAKGKAAPVEPAGDRHWPPAELTVGVVARESETEGLGDVLIPLWNPGEKGLLFLNPRGSFTDHNEEEGNLGVGYRQWLPRAGIILGVNAYYDYRDTEAHHYDQWGVGVEMLSDWIDARANYYDPDDEARVIHRQTETSSRQSARVQDRFSDPYAADHYILQDYIVTRTLTTVTSTRTFEQFEAACGGYDWELGLRLPLPIERETLEARVFGGYYDFDHDYSANAKGWKARAEVRVLSSLFLDAGVYEDDDLTGSDWFAGARLSVPLDLAKISQGRNPFATARSRLGGESRELSARLTEMVMRDSQIRVETSGFIENESLATEETTRQSQSDRQTIPLMADVAFVDGAGASAEGDGTAERPFATIQQGVDAVFGTRNVYVFAAPSAYMENVVLTEGVNLWGSGYPVAGLGGRVFGGEAAPVVDGAGRGPSITLANDSRVTGFLVQNTATRAPGMRLTLPVAGEMDVSRVGILGNDVNNVTLTGNILTGNSIGLLLARQGDFRLNLSHSRISGNSGNGAELWVAGNSGTCDISITRAAFDGNAGDGLQILASTYDDARIRIRESQFMGNGGSGLDVWVQDTGDARTQLTSIMAGGNSGHGMEFRSSGNPRDRMTLSDVTSTNNGTLGLSVQAMSNGSFRVDIEHALFQGNRSGGARLTAEAGAAAEFHLNDMLSSGNDGHGVFVGTANVEDSRIAIRDTTANANQGNGIFTLQTNGSALRMRPAWTGEARVEMDGVEANGNTNGIGIEVLQAGNLSSQAAISNAVASGNGEAGLAVIQSETELALAVGSDSTVEGNAGTGAVVVQDENSVSLVSMSGMQAQDNGGNGILVQQLDTRLALANISGSAANRNTHSGIVLAQHSQMASVGMVGMPEGVESIVTGLVAQAEIELPAEILPLLSAAGPVTASQNGENGVHAQIMTEGLVSLGGFFDITANRNGVGGVSAAIINPEGAVAAGLAGSSRNWGEILQLGAQLGGLLDLDLPTDIVGTGQMQLNGNGITGLQMLTMGESVAVNAVAGLEATSNGMWGAISMAQSDGLAANALARVIANSNGAGIGMIATSLDMAALNLLADVEASYNGNNGILSIVNCQSGTAAMVAFSTDALRPLEPLISEYIGQPFELPGTTFGPVVASQNGGVGILSTVHGGESALTVLLDAQADFNGADGMYLDTFSDEGGASSIVASSERLMDVANAALGIDPPLTNAGLGAVSASGNMGNGIVIDQGGAYGAFSVLAGVEANQNMGGSGIVVGLSAMDDDAQLLMFGVGAHANAAHGLDIDLFSLNEDVLAGLVDISSMYNATQGIQFAATSTGDDALVLMAGMETSQNGGDGLAAELTAGEYVSMALSAMGSVSNGANGANIQLAAGDDIDFFAGTNAVEQMDALYDFTSMAGSFSNQVPQGRVYFSQNGGDGLRVDGTTTGASGDIYSTIAGITANGNTGLGIRTWMDAYASTGNIDDDLSGVEALGNTGAYDVLQHARIQAAGSVILDLEGNVGTSDQQAVVDP